MHILVTWTWPLEVFRGAFPEVKVVMNPFHSYGWMWHDYVKFRVICTFLLECFICWECHYPLFSFRNKVLEIQKTLLSLDFMQDPLMRYSIILCKTMKLYYCLKIIHDSCISSGDIIFHFSCLFCNLFIYVRFLWDYILAAMKLIANWKWSFYPRFQLLCYCS